MLAGSVRARGDPLRQPDREWWVWIPGAKREPSTTVYFGRLKFTVQAGLEPMEIHLPLPLR